MQTDEQLVEKLKSGDEYAESELFLRYKFYVTKMARGYYLVGGDVEDLIQEGMIGLYQAIKGYQTGHNTMFKTFAITCIKHRLQGAIAKANTKKNKVLSEAVSFHKFEDHDSADGDDYVFEYLTFASTPVDKLIDEENYQNLKKTISQILSPFEQEALNFYLQGYTYTEIAWKLHITRRALDNALARVRAKLRNQLK